MLDKLVLNLFPHVILLQRLCGSSLDLELHLSSAELGLKVKVVLVAKDYL